MNKESTGFQCISLSRIDKTSIKHRIIFKFYPFTLQLSLPQLCHDNNDNRSHQLSEKPFYMSSHNTFNPFAKFQGTSMAIMDSGQGYCIKNCRYFCALQNRNIGQTSRTCERFFWFFYIFPELDKRTCETILDRCLRSRQRERERAERVQIPRSWNNSVLYQFLWFSANGTGHTMDDHRSPSDISYWHSLEDEGRLFAMLSGCAYLRNILELQLRKCFGCCTKRIR